jgi:organic radical activating enzyme
MPEPRTQNPEPRTQNPEPRTQNPEPRTQNPEHRDGDLIFVKGLKSPSQEKRGNGIIHVLYSKEFINKINQWIKKVIPEYSFIYKMIYFFFMWVTAGMRLKKRKTLRIEVHITDHCNLNCKSCNVYSPLAAAGFLDIGRLQNDLKRLSELTGGVLEDILMIGGEPLLHPKITEICKITREYFPKVKIGIITNGLLLQKMDAVFWKTCKEYNINITITKYPIKLDMESIKYHAKLFEVSLNILYEKSERAFYVVPFDANGNQNPKKSFKYCCIANRCIILRDGKLSCNPVLYINRINSHFNINLTVSENDYIDIYTAENIDKILAFLSKEMPFCRYCDVMHTRFGQKWAVSKKERGEWF